jgi:hypothetical protein
MLNAKEDRMSYKVYYTDVDLSPTLQGPDLSKLIPILFDSLDVAIENAFTFIEDEAIVWGIEGPNGFQMNRAEVEKAYYKSKNSR